MVDKKFFQEYDGLQKERGIPGVRMNQPLATNALANIGLEIEIEGVNLPRDGHLEKIVGARSLARWMAIADGSLRGEAREYIFTLPCFEDELEPLVTGLYDTFKTNGATLRLSNRCSTHVHINMKGKTVNLVTSAIAMWAMFEDVIVPWCGEERTSNHFCLTTKDASASLLPAWESYLRSGGGNFDERGNLKYCALNIFPLFSKGSIEMRCGPRPETAERVMAFARFCHKLVTYSERYVNPQLIANDISEKGALSMFREIVFADDKFFDEVVTLAGGVDSFNQKCMDGFRRAQSIVMGHPWDLWLDLINKEFVPDPFRKASSRSTRVPPRRPVQEEDRPARVNNPDLEEVFRLAERDAIEREEADEATRRRTAQEIFEVEALRQRMRANDAAIERARNAIANPATGRIRWTPAPRPE